MSRKPRQPRKPREPRANRKRKSDDFVLGTICPRAAKIFADGLADYLEHCEEDNRKPEAIDCTWEHLAINMCESPIEQQMLAALIFASMGYGCWPTPMWDHTEAFPPPDHIFFVTPQYHFGEYRVDLAVFVRDESRNEYRIAIECDGHEFHKTKEQAERDRRRDRFLQLNGWRTIRFTGSEIWRDAKSCAEEVAEFVTDLIDADLQRRGEIVGGYRERQLQKLGYKSPFAITWENCEYTRISEKRHAA